MICPKCRTASLSVLHHHGLPLAARPYKCRQCFGLWVPHDVYSRLGEAPEQIPEPDQSSLASASSADQHSGLCPEGHGILSRTKITTFYLERCSKCQGIWFDAGEWRQIAEMHLVETLPQYWSVAWRRNQRGEDAHHTYREWAKKHFGPSLFGQLTDLARELSGSPLRSEALAYLQSESSPDGSDEPGDA